MTWFQHRRREAEWMDREDVDPALLGKSLKFIRRVNRLLGYTRATIAHLESFSRGWNRGERISIIDFATGSADVPLAILKWAHARGFDLRIVGVDLHAQTARAARSSSPDPRLQIVRADALSLPFEANSFDYAITGLFLHHLSDEQAVAVLGAMDRVARRGIIAADLIRTRRAYAWISLFTLLANPMVRHDAKVSVAQAFSKDEAFALRDRAKLDYLRYFRYFGHRFVLAGQKSELFPVEQSHARALS